MVRAVLEGPAVQARALALLRAHVPASLLVQASRPVLAEHLVQRLKVERRPPVFVRHVPVSAAVVSDTRR